MQEEVSKVILRTAGKSDRFTVRWWIFTFFLKIRPLSAKQIIELSDEVVKIGTVSTDTEMFPTMVSSAKDLRFVARAIAIATGSKWQGIVTKAILKLSLKDIETLFNIVKRQSDMERFFFILIGAKGLNEITKGKEE